MSSATVLLFNDSYTSKILRYIKAFDTVAEMYEYAEDSHLDYYHAFDTVNKKVL